MPIKVDDPRDIQSAYDDRLTPQALHQAETQPDGSHDNIPDYDRANDGLDAREGEFDAAANTGAAENNTPGSWLNNTTVGGGNVAKGFSKFAKSITLKKAGPTAVISSTLAAAGISMSLLFSPSIMLNHIKEVILDRHNIQNTAIDIRSNKILSKKLSSTMTSGCKISITCKFNKMSNAALQRMADEGIVPYDKAGNKLDLKNGKWGSQRPAEFRISDELKAKGDFKVPANSNGVEAIDAKALTKFLSDNPTAAGVYRRAFNPRWTAFWDTTYNKFLSKIGFGSKSSKIQGNSEEEVKASIAEEIDATDKDAHVNASEKGQTADENATADQKQNIANDNAQGSTAASDVNDLVGDAGNTASKDLVNKIKGKISGGAMMVANLYCLAANDGPKIAKALRSIQIAQLVSFGLLFLQAADEIKAGHGEATKVALIASMFTEGSVDNKTGKVLKKSAMESDGMLYALAGNTTFSSTTSDAARWIPGGGFIQIMYKIANMLTANSSEVKAAIGPVCNVASSWIGDLAGLVLDFTPAGAIITAATWLITNSQPFQEMMASIFQNLAGKIVDSTLANEDFGNAAAIGMVLGLGEGANAGAMMPLTVDQAVAYSRATQESRLANARIDQATLSPFDASSPNTFMGSIMTQLIPYYSLASDGPVGAIAAASRVVTSTFGSILTPSAFADSNLTSEELRSCPDVGIKLDGIAAGPICDVQYGIPVNWLQDIDPADNVAWLVNNGQVEDDENGTIKSGSKLEEYLTNCQGGEDATTKACIIDSEEKARYALYFVDHRIQQNMDGEEEYGGASASTSSTSSSVAASTGDDTPAELRKYAQENYNRTNSGQSHVSWLGMIPGQCASFAAWKAAKIWYGSALTSDGSNLAELVQSKPMPGRYALAWGNGSEVATNLIAAGVATTVSSLRETQPGDIVSVRSGSAAGHVFVIAANDGKKITVEDYNAIGGHDRYGRKDVSFPDGEGLWSQDNVIAIARVKAGGGQ